MKLFLFIYRFYFYRNIDILNYTPIFYIYNNRIKYCAHIALIYIKIYDKKYNQIKKNYYKFYDLN